uniref:ARAD1C00176p n=1 Tax=Blastobotrys adeninivorans TaxID=409370 RepID=A0A060T3Y8_BLAAD
MSVMGLVPIHQTMTVTDLTKDPGQISVQELPDKDLMPPRQEVDQAYAYGLETAGTELDPEVEKKVLLKIDLFILPLMCALMSCQLMDKSTNSYASIIGLREDLNMTSLEYSWVGSAFYLGYLVFEFPANMLLQRFPLSKTLSFAVVSWGVVICCHGACNSSATFLLCRVLLGFLEAFMDPAYMILTSQWYKRSEQYKRSAVWLGFQGFGTMLGSGIAYGFYKHQDSFSMAPWRLLYVIAGVITIFFGLISFVHVPDIPVKAWFLTEKEKVYVVERVRENRTGFGNQKFKLRQFKEAMCDITTYIFFFFMFGYGIPNGGIGNFGSLLLKQQFGFGTGQALLMNMVGSGIDIIFPLAFALLNYYVIPSRLLTCFLINCLIFTALCLLAFSHNRVAQIVGYEMSYFTTASWACMSSVVSSNVAGHTKKVTANTIFLIGFAAGNIIGPQSFLGSEAPVYITAKRVMVGTYVASAIAPFILFWIYFFRNKKKSNNAMSEGHVMNSEFADKTDKENPEFKYCL